MRQVLDTELFNAQQFDTDLQADPSGALPLFRDTLKTANQILIDRFHAGRAATELVYTRASLIDALLTRAWALYLPNDAADIALLAVGGYGRGELHPCSDIDVLILLQQNDEPYREGISAFLTFLWDIGLEVGHSVRSVEECLEEATKDITVATNIQEARLLVGNAGLFEEQRRLCSADQIWPGPEFFKAKWEEQIQRHYKYNETGYNLEPNIKESPGGLRDIQMIGWVAKRHFGVDTLRALVDHDFLTREEYQQLHEGQAFLWQVRFGVHVLAGRREDRLLFDHQRILAKQFGYRDTPQKLAVEQFMKQYYRTVMELSRLNEMLLQLFQEEILYHDDPGEPIKINRRFQARKGFLEVRHDKIFKHYPFALLEIFLLLEQHRELKGVRANTIRLIRQDRDLIDASFREDLRNRSLFMEIMRQTSGVTHELRRMNRYGILAAYLPEFGRIVGQMQHDLFHVYTVDEHTLMLIRNLRRFTVPKFVDEFPFCSELIKQIPKQELLLITGLYHDIAKGRGGDHSVLGAVDAEAFCRHHGLSDYDTKLVVWLVQNHLVMSTTAQRKDISDPEVVHEFACQVGNKSRLDYLYLLTVADIRATSDKVWNSWKGALLKELYDATRRAYRRGLQNPVIQSEYIEDTRRQANQLLEHSAYTAQSINALWDKLGDEYFLRYLPEEIVWHTEAILSCDDPNKAVVLMRDMPSRGGTELFIYTKTYDTLFLQATSLLERSNVTILDARIFSTSDGYSLDSFLITDHEYQPLGESNQSIHLLELLQANIAQPPEAVPEVSRHTPRQIKHFEFPTEVEFEQHETLDRTVMHVKALDRPGLLSRIARALHDCEVQLSNARVATFGERAEDIFDITDKNEQSIRNPSQLKRLEQSITKYLNNEHAA
jgi:[protein-PII] uridylyltransferase